jgi:hypothetical protein
LRKPSAYRWTIWQHISGNSRPSEQPIRRRYHIGNSLHDRCSFVRIGLVLFLSFESLAQFGQQALFQHADKWGQSLDGLDRVNTFCMIRPTG